MEPAEPLVLPSAPAPSRRAALPLIAAAAPLASGVLLWQLTGSVTTLWFAAISPLMLLASFLDVLRNGRRERRRSAAEEAEAWQDVEQRFSARSDAERRRAAREAPDVLRCLTEVPLRSADAGDEILLAVGRGRVPSPVRLSGGEGERARAFREQRATLDDMTVTASLRGGVCVRGSGPVARAVLRALVLQLCLRFDPGAIRLTGEGVAELGFESAPQARGRDGKALRVHVGIGSAAGGAGQVVLLLLDPGARPPAGIETVIDVDAPETAIVRSATQEIRCVVEGLSAAQTRAVLAAVDARRQEDGPPAEAAFAEVRSSASAVRAQGQEGDAGLRVAIGLASGAVPVSVDLVRDGPHALVAGITGAGKSELLVTWVTAIAGAFSPDEVAFVLADFKGGTAFETLRPLPHVAAVITDLYGHGAERGVRSLRAELRRREAVLAGHGARGIEEAPAALPRLVVVVDEFAAFLHEHPQLGAVFTDLAARGRALGMHLILGTQRATGVIREALAANCPLRFCLRVSEPQDSRLMLGTDEASALPGDDAGRGLAFVRRAGDGEPVLVRIARTGRDDVRAVAEDHRGTRRAVSPWLPPLPAAISAAELSLLRRSHGGEVRGGDGAAGFVLGLVDEPERQRQSVLVLDPARERGVTVFGGPGTGKSTVVAALREQSMSVLEVPADLERAWTSVAELAEGRRRFPALLLVDDLDGILSRYPADYATAWAGLLQRVIRSAPARGTVVVVTTSRCSGPVAPIADLLPRRVLLRLPSRAEHLAAGGDTDGFDAARPPGRGRSDAHEIQLVGMPEASGRRRPGEGSEGRRRVRESASSWRPEAQVTVVVAPAPERTATAIGRAFPDCLARTVDTLPPTLRGSDVEALGDGGRIVLVGDPDSWQRRFSLWQDLRERAEALVLAEAARELRTLAGIRELPPYAETDAGRAWALRAGALRGRVVIPGLAAHAV